MLTTAFYESGLKFSCKRCSACCRYETGYVYLSEKDLDDLALHLKMDNISFIKTYCCWVTGSNGQKSLSLREKSNYDCILWDSGCTVYQARPVQCRTFPFWDSVVASSQAWEMAASGCPGINHGELHSGGAIAEYLKQRDDQDIIKIQGDI